MACTTEYRNLMVTKRKALSSARGCRGGILTNGLRKKLEDDARATIASIIKKYTGSCLVNGYHQPSVLPPPLLTPLKNGLNGTAKHLIGRISYKEAISKYMGKHEEHRKTTGKDKKLKKRVSFGPSTVKIFGESDYYDGEKELIKKELAEQKPRNLKKALRGRNKEKIPVIVTGRRSSFCSAQTQIKHQAKRQKHKIKGHVRNMLSKVVNEHNRPCSPGRPTMVKVRSPGIQDCARRSFLSKSSKSKETRGRPPKQECKGRPPEIKKCQKSLSVISRCKPLTTNTSKDHELPIKADENYEESSKLPKLPDKAFETIKYRGRPPKITKCHTSTLASIRIHNKPPKITKGRGRPPKITKSPGKLPKRAKSPGRPPKITKSPGRPPKITKSPGKPPKITKSPGRPPKITKSPGRPPKITKSPGKPPERAKSPGRPPKITKSPGRSPKITKGSGLPKIIKSRGMPPKIIKSPGRPPKIPKSSGRPPKITKSRGRPPKIIKSRGRPPKIIKSCGGPLNITNCRGRPPTITKGRGRPPKIIKSHGMSPKLTKSCNKSGKNSKCCGRPSIIKHQNKTLKISTSCRGRPPKDAKSKAKTHKVAVRKTTTKKNNAQIARLYTSCAMTYKLKKNCAYLTPYERKLFLKNYTLLKKMQQSLKKS